MADERRTFTLPSDFDDDTLFAVMLKVGELDTEFRSHNNGQPSDAWRGFAMACEGIRVRFRTMAESDESYRAIIPKGAETHDDRYEEERSVFAFFTSLISTFECTCYMLFALGAQLDPTAFKMTTENQKKAIAPKSTLEAFKRKYPQEPLTQSINSLFAPDGFCSEAYDVRNILSHRGNLQRAVNVDIDIRPGGPSEHHIIGGPNQTVIPTLQGVPMNAELTASRRSWIGAWTTDTLARTLDFCKSQI